jgi:serine/threonine protein kinase
MLYEMLAGARPFRGTSQVETMHAIISDPAPPLANQPPEMEEILAKALAKDPKDRFTSTPEIWVLTSAGSMLAPVQKGASPAGLAGCQ